MPRRSALQWKPSSILILVVVAILVALGAAYWVQISQQVGSQLAAAKPPKQESTDPRCTADSEEVTLGEIIIKADPFTPKYPYPETIAGARKQALANARKWIKSWNCNTTFVEYAGKIVGGTVQEVGKEGVGVRDSVRDFVKCSIKTGTNDVPLCKTSCDKIGTQCLNTTAPKDSASGTEKEGDECYISKNPKGPAGGPYEGIEITCTVRGKVSAICKCVSKEVSVVTPEPAYYVSTPIEENEEMPTTPECSWWTSWFGCEPTPTLATPTPIATITPIMETPTATPTVIMTPITSTPTTTPTTTPPVTI